MLNRAYCRFWSPVQLIEFHMMRNFHFASSYTIDGLDAEWLRKYSDEDTEASMKCLQTAILTILAIPVHGPETLA